MDLKVADILFEFTSFTGVKRDSSAKPDLFSPWDAAVVVKDLDKTIDHLEALGIGPFIQPDPPPGAGGLFYEDKPLTSNSRAKVARLGDMQLEIIQPDDKPNNPWIEFLTTRGGGIHHVGFQVSDVEAEVKRLTSLGAEVSFYGKINGKIGAAYVDLKFANLVIELTSFNE